MRASTWDHGQKPRPLEGRERLSFHLRENPSLPGAPAPGAAAHTHLSSGLSTSIVTVCCTLWGFLRANSKNSAVPGVTWMVCVVVMARLRALEMLSAFVRSR